MLQFQELIWNTPKLGFQSLNKIYFALRLHERLHAERVDVYIHCDENTVYIYTCKRCVLYQAIVFHLSVSIKTPNGTPCVYVSHVSSKFLPVLAEARDECITRRLVQMMRRQGVVKVQY